MVIREHVFNSQWWGAPVGIVDSPQALLAMPANARIAALDRFAFVELRGRDDALGLSRALAAIGFYHVDTQLAFRIGLSGLRSSDTIERLQVSFADEVKLVIDAENLADFRHERYLQLPGIRPYKVASRYATWGNALVEQAPATCLALYDDDALQGYFLSQLRAGSLHLTLAMLTRDARITGHHLYLRALLAYAERGHRTGRAEFSASNTAVLNIYAGLGARFLTAEQCFLWTP
ncbi:hypothetical protein CKJ65_15135 [Mycobacterium intracellulare]|uniref:hypothetical protein n=1 Tax=Mycobacterium intracellulare TaxID=1767 RepID=UPI000BAEC6B4|nr:hypothetical protein [Mycobacterium intracellulare]PBA31087.1 hypothetical protein CKJ65_15135 [Mycobacterium intracellulare]